MPVSRSQPPRPQGAGSRQLALITAPANRLGEAIFDLLGSVPVSSEPPQQDPERRARVVGNAAAHRAALTAGGLALPAGPIGWLTVLPELVAVWRLQAQMVADIAGIYGRQASLTREQMVYCLFRHTAAQAMRDMLARVGGRILIQQVPLQTLQRIARSVGISVSKRALGRGLARWLPVAGAVGVGAYAWFDTRQVANTAIALFGEGRAGAVLADEHGVPLLPVLEGELLPPEGPDESHGSGRS